MKTGGVQSVPEITHIANPREFMELAMETMRNSISENRTDKTSPFVGAVLFSTLEPCAPGARSHKKEPCAKRIVDRRIAKVWVGIEDPDPLVDS